MVIWQPVCFALPFASAGDTLQSEIAPLAPAVAIALLVAPWCILYTESSLAERSGDPQQRVSIDDVLTRAKSSVQNVRWLNSRELIAEFSEPRSVTTVSRTVSLNGVLGTPLVEGPFASISPDGKTVLRWSDPGWMIKNIPDGEPRPIADLRVDGQAFSILSKPAWSYNGQYVAITGVYRPTTLDGMLKRTMRDGVAIIDKSSITPARERWASCITIVDQVQAKAIQHIVVDDVVRHMRWGLDGSLYASQIKFFDPTPNTSVLKISLNAEHPEIIYRSPGRYQRMAPAIHPNGRIIALALDIDNRAWDDFSSFLVIDAATGSELRRLTTALPVLGPDYVWSPNGEELYSRVRSGGLDQIYAISLHGKPRQLTDGPRRHFDVDVSPDGRRLSYQTVDGYGRRDVRVLDFATGTETTVLVTDDPTQDFNLGNWQQLRWKSTDGVKPFGYLITPPEFDRDKKYPMIVYVHGGGPGSRLYMRGAITAAVAPSPLEWHAWAALGYVVFVPDYRSTGGYGPDVIAARYEKGEIAAIDDIEDVISGTRFVMEQGFIDPSRVAVFGHSAGGQRVYILLTKYDLYAAAIIAEAIAPDPVSDFINGTSGENTGNYPVGIYRQHYGGLLAEVPKRYKLNYMFDSFGNSTPTLIIVGNEERGGVKHMPSEVLYSILKQHGVATRLLSFVEDGHNFTSPTSARLAFKEVRQWLETHMPKMVH